jgi:hypothetical protein
VVSEINHSISRRHAGTPVIQATERVTPLQQVQTPELERVCPYRGLEVFREEDVRFFFGRETFVDQLRTKVAKQQLPLVIITGASGSGKSSVVRAGLLPWLRLEQPAVWEAAIFTPGEAPFRNLVEALALTDDKPLDPWQRTIKANERAAYLASGALTLAEAVDITLAATGGKTRFLLIVDQFEEVFTLTRETERKPFIDALLASIEIAPVTVLLTLRADFFQQAMTLTRALSDRLPQSLVTLGPLLGEEWRTIIEEPAKRVGLRFEAGLIERILKDVEAQPDSLPLLEYALTELWQHKQGMLLTHTQYADLGGVEGAISKKADEVLTSIPPAQHKRALHALTQLVQVAIDKEGGADTRRHARRTDLGEASWQTLQPFVGARLLVTNHQDRTGEDVVEIAHEALIRRWEKLQVALEQDREFLSWRRRLGFRMQEWEAADYDEGALLHGAILTEAQRWLTERPADLTAREQEFITWAERDSYQIEQILSKGLPALVQCDGNR